MAPELYRMKPWFPDRLWHVPSAGVPSRPITSARVTLYMLLSLSASSSSSVAVVQSLSPVQLSVTPRTAAHQASLSFTLSSLLPLMSTDSMMPSNHLILCHPSPLAVSLSIPPSIGVLCNESALRIEWPRYWSFSFSISPSSEYSGLISFRIDWFDLAVQGALKSLLQHHNSKASVLQSSAFFMVQLTSIHDY